MGHLELKVISHLSFLALCTVPARGSVRGVHVLRVSMFSCTYSSLLSNATHPCLLSSSGSGPVELEHGAQRLSASEDFTLRAKETENNRVSTSKFCAIFPPLGSHNISVIAQKQWQNRTQVVVSTQSVYFPHRCHRLCYLFNLYWTWSLEIDISFSENVPGRKTTPQQPRAAFVACNPSKSWDCPDVLYCHSENHKHQWGNSSALDDGAASCPCDPTMRRRGRRG